MPAHNLTAILPCNDLDASVRLYARLGLKWSSSPKSATDDHYRMLVDAAGAELHLNKAVEGWLIPGTNPFGLYLQAEDVDELAAGFAGELIEKSGGPEHKLWGMYEFSLSDPDGTLVRVGWPSRLRG